MKSDVSVDYDLIIVGASFAGLVAARIAALRGLSVVVLEAKKDPGARIHTTGIVVKEAAEIVDIPAYLTRRIEGVRLYAPSLNYMDLTAPGYAFQTTDMPRLMRWLAEEASRAGAKILCGTRFTSAYREGKTIVLDQPALRARYLLGCDGAKSRVAEQFRLGRNSAFLVGLESEYTGLRSVDPGFLHCFLDSRIAPGYIAWAAPAPNVTQIGLAVKGDAKPALAKFIEKTEPLFHYSEGEIVERRSGVIPCGGVVKPFATERVMLIGDSAGMVSPLTAGGIKIAFDFARKGAHAIADYLQSDGPTPEKVLAPQLPKFRLKKPMRQALSIAPPNFLYNLLIGTPPLRALAQRLYFHKSGA